MVIDKQIQRFENEVGKIPNFKFNKDLLEIIILWVGPSINHPILAFIDCNSQEEIKKVKTHFLIGKLGLKDTIDLDNTLLKITNFFIQNELRCYRVLFYYFIVVELNLTSKLIERSEHIESDDKIDYLLLEFGENLIENQKDIDLDLKKILDDNFSNLI